MLRSEESRKERPIATSSGEGVANLSHDLFFFYRIIKQFFCMQRNRFYNGIASEIKLFFLYLKKIILENDFLIFKIILENNFLTFEFIFI